MERDTEGKYRDGGKGAGRQNSNRVKLLLNNILPSDIIYGHCSIFIPWSFRAMRPMEKMTACIMKVITCVFTPLSSPGTIAHRLGSASQSQASVQDPRLLHARETYNVIMLTLAAYIA